MRIPYQREVRGITWANPPKAFSLAMREMQTRKSLCGRALAMVAFGLATLLHIAPAHAAGERPIGFSLATEGEAAPLAACGGDEALVAAVEQRLRRPVFVAPDAADIAFVVTYERSDAHIVEHDRAGIELGRRDVPLPEDDCPKALDTLAVVLAIMIGPERTTTEPRPNAPEPQPPPRVVTPPPPKPPPAEVPPPPRPRRPIRWQAAPAAEIALGSGVLPGVAWGIGAGAVITPPVPRLFAIARAEVWPSQRTGTRPSAQIDRFGGALAGCVELVRGAETTLSTCAGVDAGILRARSSGLSRTSESSMLLGVLAEGRFGYRLRARGNLSIEPFLAAQVAFLLERPHFTYRDQAGREQTLLEPAPVAVQSSLGVAVHFF